MRRSHRTLIVRLAVFSIVSACGDDELRDAVQATLQRLVDNGTAAEILEKYAVDPDGLYDPIPINIVG